MEDPLFQANQIGKLLGISNIHENLRDFSDNEKGVSLTDTPGGKQEIIFLTEYGLYRLLGRSRKPIANPFNPPEIDEQFKIINAYIQIYKEVPYDMVTTVHNALSRKMLDFTSLMEIYDIVITPEINIIEQIS